ncbi:MAG: hypothetical protein PHV34_06400 [Verrucomicrobiae bacterium]|nr:hypothetical protein [Verrucomicrobiae bacterium]
MVLPAQAPSSSTPDLQAYAIQPEEFKKAAATIQPMLSADGRIIEDFKNKRLMVLDRPEIQKKISVLYQPWTAPVSNVRIFVRSLDNSQGNSRQIDATWNTRVGNATIQRGPPGTQRGIQVRARTVDVMSDSNTQQQILVASGCKAMINVSEEIPDVGWFLFWGAPYGLWATEPQWKEVGAKLAVQPFVLPNGFIRIRLVPTLNRLVDRQWLITEVQQLATEVTVMDGQEVDLGGLQSKDSEFMRRFFQTYQQGGSARQVQLKLRAVIEELPPRPDYKE